MLLSGREWDVMNVLWERGSATVAEVLDELQDELAYTTILTILRRLEEKGHVEHSPDGKAHRYGAPCKGGAFLQVKVLPRQLAVQPRSYGRTAHG